jgi:hypothetical protein
MPQLVKLQEELKDAGFVIIANHVQQATKDELAQLCRKNRVNYPVITGGSVPGERLNGIPAAYLFDSSGKLIERGRPTEMKKKIHDLMATEPHFLAAGRKYTKLAPLAESLKKTKAYGQVLKALERDAKGDGPAAEEAKYLQERIQAYGKRRLDAAKALEEEDPFLSQQAYAEVATLWKGAEAGDQATARLKELKADKDFQEEFKACTVLRQMLSECEKLIATAGTINLDYPSNKKIAVSVRQQAMLLKKKFPKSKAAGRMAEALAPYGFKEA